MSLVPRRRANRPRPRVEALEGRLLLALAGTPAPGFGGGTGYASIPLGVPADNTSGFQVTESSVVSGPSGQVVVSGTATSFTFASGFALDVAEFNADGTLNTAFGGGGRVQIPLAAGTVGNPISAIQSDGKILEALYGAADSAGAAPILVVRLNANGTVDSGFGTNGVAIIPTDGPNASGANPLTSLASLAVQTNGQIVLAGTTYATVVSDTAFAAMRLNANGTIDTTYGQGGIANILVKTTYQYGDDQAVGAVLQSDGKLVVVGQVTVGLNVNEGEFGTLLIDVAAIRLTSTGTLDTTYGNSSFPGAALLQATPGTSNASERNDADGVAIQADDKVLISGNGLYAGNTLYRLTTAGVSDPSFGTNGQIIPVVSGPVVVQANGSIDVVGPTHPAQSQYLQSSIPAGPIFVAQFDAQGHPVTSFGNTSVNQVGVLQIPAPLVSTPSALGNPIPSPQLLAIQPTTGDIIVSGVGSTPSLQGRILGFTVGALVPSATTGPAARPIPTAPASFDGSGQTNLAIYNPGNGAFYSRPAAVGINSPDVVNPFGPAGVSQSIPAAADYLGTGQTQAAVYIPSLGDYAIQAVAGRTTGLLMQFGIPGAGQTIPVPADYEGTGQADVAIYLTSLAEFAILPSNGSAGRFVPFGIVGPGQSIPAPADYYGTGQADVAVYLARLGAFAVQDPTGKTTGEIVPFGKPGLGQSIPVPGDYDGSGHVEFAVYVPSVGAYFYRPYGGGADVEVLIGTPNTGEIPVPGDYDGSGRTEVAIFDPKGAFFEDKPANGGPVVLTYFGTPGNGTIPVAALSGSLPEFAPPGGGGGGSGMAIRLRSAPSGGSGSAASITARTSTAVPSGPTPASIRVARTLVNQAAPDRLKMS